MYHYYNFSLSKIVKLWSWTEPKICFGFCLWSKLLNFDHGRTCFGFCPWLKFNNFWNLIMDRTQNMFSPWSKFNTFDHGQNMFWVLSMIKVWQFWSWTEHVLVFQDSMFSFFGLNKSWIGLQAQNRDCLTKPNFKRTETNRRLHFWNMEDP